MLRMLLESCRAVGDSESTSRVQTAVERLNVFVRMPVATTLVQGSKHQYEKRKSGPDDAEVDQLWMVIRQRTAYSPQLRALPWAFTQNRTREQQEGSLKLHPEKKALAILLACCEIELKVAIEFHACMDCHEFFKKSSLLLERMVQLQQPKMVHSFSDGSCSCNDWWRWEARLSPAALPMIFSQGLR